MALQIAKVTKQLPLLTGAMSAYPYDEGLESLYTFESPFDGKVCGAIRQGKTLWVPRESAPYSNEDYRSFYPPHAIDCTITWRLDQEARCQESLTFLRNGRSHIFEAATGWGKTIAGVWIAAQLGQPTLIVVTKDDLVTQWRAALSLLGVSPHMVGHVQGDIENWKGKQFVIGMVQSLMIPDKYSQKFWEYFGLMILDEVHQMAADCFIRVCQQSHARLRLGFSATPKRKDGKTQLLYWHIGPTLVRGTVLSMKPKVLVRRTSWCLPAQRRREGDTLVWKKMPCVPGRMMPVMKAMASSEGRNLEIVNFVRQSYAAGRTTLVLSDLRDHLTRLFQMLANQGIPGNDIGYYVGGMSQQELKLTKTRRIVLGTFKMCSTGTDVPHWDTLVLTMPHADVKQSIGRVLRFADDKREPVILDLVDHEPIFNGFHQARMKQYYELGATIVKI